MASHFRKAAELQESKTLIRHRPQLLLYSSSYSSAHGTDMESTT